MAVSPHVISIVIHLFEILTLRVLPDESGGAKTFGGKQMHNKSLDARRNSDFVTAARVTFKVARRRFRPRQFNRWAASL